MKSHAPIILAAIFIFFALTLGLTQQSNAAISLQRTSQSSPTSGVSCAIPGLNVNAGDLLVVSAVVANSSSSATISVSDTASNTYKTAVLTSSTQLGTGITYALYYVESATGGMTTTTVTGTNSNPPLCLEAEYSGATLSNSLETQNVSTVTVAATTLVTGNVTTALTNELLVAVAGETGSPVYTAGTNYAIEASSTKSALEDRIVSAAGTYNATMTTSASSKYVFGVFAFKPATTTIYQQTAYRWFANNNGTQIGSPLTGAQDASTTLVLTGSAFRLRMLISAGAVDSTAGVDQFKLQVATTSAACSSTLSFADVSTSSGNIRFKTNGSAANGALLTASSTDPTHGADPIVTETYGDQNNFSVTSTITAGSDGKWDFSLVDFSAPTSTSYCFRAVKSDGTLLTGYGSYPQITTAGASVPTLSAMLLNGGSAITLTPNTTTTITVVASTTDTNGNLLSATSTIYRSGVSGGAQCQADDQNCYQIPASKCAFSNSSSTVSCSADIWYFAQATDSSSSFSGQTWKAAITLTDDTANTVTTSTASGVALNTMVALNVTSTASYGGVVQGTNTTSTNQIVTVTNAGNATTTLQISGTALTLGANTIATSSQHYATTSFTYGGSEQVLSGTASAVTGFKLVNPPAYQTWINTTPLPAALELFGAAVSGSTLYIVGGASNGSGTTSTTYFAPFNTDGTVGTFATTTVLPYKLSQFGNLIASKGYLYVIGGAAPNGVTSSVLYAKLNADNSIGTWNYTSAIPTALAVLGTAVCNNYLYAVGGSTLGGGLTGMVSSSYYAAINADGSVAAWSSTTALPTALDKIFPISQNGYVYIFGGQPVNNTNTSTVLFAKCNSDGTITSWQQGTPLEYGIEGQAVTGDNNFAYILGGDSTGSGGDSSTVSYMPFSPGGMTGQGGQNFPLLPQKAVSRNAGVMYNGNIYSIGGKPPTDTSTIAYMAIPNQNLYWGVQVSSTQATGTYTGAINYTAVFSP